MFEKVQSFRINLIRCSDVQKSTIFWDWLFERPKTFVLFWRTRKGGIDRRTLFIYFKEDSLKVEWKVGSLLEFEFTKMIKVRVI